MVDRVEGILESCEREDREPPCRPRGGHEENDAEREIIGGEVAKVVQADVTERRDALSERVGRERHPATDRKLNQP